MYTKRQESLIRRLERICHNIDNLPVHVEKILVFGSFLRRKPEPGDVDIALIYSDYKDEWKRLTNILGRRVTLNGVNEFARPLDQLMSRIPTDLKPFSEKWLGLLKWGSIKGVCYHVVCMDEPSKVIQKILLKGTREIKLMGMYGPLYQEKIPSCSSGVIWTAESPDVRKNIERLWSEETLWKNTYIDFVCILEDITKAVRSNIKMNNMDVVDDVKDTFTGFTSETIQKMSLSELQAQVNEKRDVLKKLKEPLPPLVPLGN